MYADRPAELDPIRCSEFKREPREDENADDEWRAVSDGVGELHIFCPECWEREFGSSVSPNPVRSAVRADDDA
jgi:hypothetical protein